LLSHYTVWRILYSEYQSIDSLSLLSLVRLQSTRRWTGRAPKTWYHTVWLLCSGRFAECFCRQ
jgi:hypothetical protein